ncbi:hypothetical protein EB796_013011 [Bugula neritina]|uniref:Uncharacterized protein n=1 Tax=Bugula neritina TaxID=10212 RepID=A0A7J7JQR6_BUGNE|nr:hypothetical protein EB796_013011 [Bugula neritina]
MLDYTLYLVEARKVTQVASLTILSIYLYCVVSVDNECQLTQSEYSTEEYQSSSSSACEVVSSSASEIVSGFLRLNRYSNTEDLSKLTFDDSPADSDMEDINQNSRLSLSPSDLRACTPPPSTKNSTTEAIYVNISSADGLKADVNLQDAVPLSQLPTMSIIVQSNCRKSPECTVSTRDVTHLKHSTPQHVDLTPQHVDLTPRVGLTNISGPLRSPKVTPKLGPSSITVSGVSAHETVAQPPSRKYRRVTCRRLASESSDVISRHIESPQTLYKSYITVPRSSPSNTSSTDSTLRLSSQTTNTRSQSIASPASMICRESFILKRQSKVTDLYQTHVNISSAGSIIVAPPRHVSDKDSRLQPACGTSVSHPPTHEAERFLSSFSILRGQPTNHSHLSHAHGSCNHSLSTSAIWERNVGLPPNWSGIVVHQPSGDGRETHSDVTRISRSRASSESYSTGYLTPTRNYVKVLSMESAEGEPAEYREAIYINPSEVTKTSQEVVTTPTSSASPVELVSNAVKGVQCLVTSVKPAGNLYKDDSRSDVTGSDVTGSVAAGSDVTGSDVTSLIVDAGEKEEDKSPSQEFTRVCLERNVQEPVNSQPASRLPQHLKERFTSEASLSCEPGAYIAYNPEDVRGSKFHGRYEPARGTSTRPP